MEEKKEMITDQDIENRFTYHKPDSSKNMIFVQMRELARDFAYFIVRNTPESREQSLAITKLEEVVFWANAGLARKEE